MTTHITATRDKWLEARLDLLAAEKDLTRRSDEVASAASSCPGSAVDKTYRFDTETGSKTLKDLFDGRSQLLVYHFMFGPDYKAGCPSCSAIADGFNGYLSIWQITMSRFRRCRGRRWRSCRRIKQRMGWTFPWASSLGGNFNYDFNVSFTEEQQRKGSFEYNYARGAHAMDAKCATGRRGKSRPWPVPIAATYMRERPGMSAFVLEDGVVYHTYSTYARGLDGLWGMYQWLDRAPKGRNETGVWWRRHDRYRHD